MKSATLLRLENLRNELEVTARCLSEENQEIISLLRETVTYLDEQLELEFEQLLEVSLFRQYWNLLWRK